MVPPHCLQVRSRRRTRYLSALSYTILPIYGLHTFTTVHQSHGHAMTCVYAVRYQILGVHGHPAGPQELISRAQ